MRRRDERERVKKMRGKERKTGSERGWNGRGEDIG